MSMPAAGSRGTAQTQRIIYVSDPSTIAFNLLPDPVEEDDLHRWVDMIADSCVDVLVQDVYNQGFTVYWRSDRFQYDQRAQHRRFLPMLDGGVQPLEVLLDRSHERGMVFLAGFRMNDTHDFPSFADFVESHPEWQLEKPWVARGIERPPEAEINRGGKPLDFTFEPVRSFVHDVMEEMSTRFEVDGLEMTFRDPGYFPPDHARERADLMTDLVRSVRATLDKGGRQLLLGARVFSSLEECLDMGLDVRTWIAEGLIDYCSPMDAMYSDFSAPYAEFGALTRDGECKLYPGLHPWTSHRMRMKSAMTPSMFRALAHTYYACGADGVSLFNHFVAMLSRPPFYPQALQVIHELRDPQRVARGERHYVFDPTWGGVIWMGMDRSTSGRISAQRVLLDRSSANSSGVFRFRLYEDMDRVSATLLVRGTELTLRDQLEVKLNGVPLAPGPLGRPVAKADEQRKQDAEKAQASLARAKWPADTRWFPLPASAPVLGENELTIALVTGDPDAAEADLVIDEVEVWVQPT